jgi:hypothetical protein
VRYGQPVGYPTSKKAVGPRYEGIAQPETVGSSRPRRYREGHRSDLARDVALKTATPFPAIGERAAGLYDEDRPIWYEYRRRVMNQRPCDYEERGIRAWKIA